MTKPTGGKEGRPAAPMIGRVFGRLTVRARSDYVKEDCDKEYKAAGWWVCDCSCGNETIGNGKVLRGGSKASCGCHLTERASPAHLALAAKRSVSPEKMDEVGRLLRAGADNVSVAKASGVGYGKVAKIRAGLGLPKFSRAGVPQTVAPDVVLVWNDEKIALLRDLWAAEHSTAEIGRRLGVSKSAVIGKAHRLDLERRPSPIAPADPQVIAQAVDLLNSGVSAAQAMRATGIGETAIYRIRNEHDIPKWQPSFGYTPARKPEFVRPEPRPSAPVIQFPRTSGACQWLDGDSPRTFVRCSEPAVVGTSWCACHTRRVFARRAGLVATDLGRMEMAAVGDWVC